MGNKGVMETDKQGNAVYPVPYYPIGYTYISTVQITAQNLHDLYGGTWTQIKDKFLLCCGDTYVGGATGGEEQHTLTVEEMPNHSHKLKTQAGGAISGDYSDAGVVRSYTDAYKLANSNDVFSAGDSKPHNNMPPYLAVYVYTRTA